METLLTAIFLYLELDVTVDMRDYSVSGSLKKKKQKKWNYVWNSKKNWQNRFF